MSQRRLKRFTYQELEGGNDRIIIQRLLKRIYAACDGAAEDVGGMDVPGLIGSPLVCITGKNARPEILDRVQAALTGISLESNREVQLLSSAARGIPGPYLAVNLHNTLPRLDNLLELAERLEGKRPENPGRLSALFGILHRRGKSGDRSL